MNLLRIKLQELSQRSYLMSDEIRGCYFGDSKAKTVSESL